MMQMVIANASKGDPYPIDTLFMYMANMAWNSAMNSAENISRRKASFVICVLAKNRAIPFGSAALPVTANRSVRSSIALMPKLAFAMSPEDCTCATLAITAGFGMRLDDRQQGLMA